MKCRGYALYGISEVEMYRKPVNIVYFEFENMKI